VQKVLNQKEIDAMVLAARGGKAGKAGEPLVSAWDVRQAGQIGRAQLEAMNALHGDFARNLTDAVAGYLRASFAAALVSAQNLAYGEFLSQVPDVTYLASFRLLPLGTTGLLQLDLSAAYPLIDVLLGGEGTGMPPERQITGLEEQILESVVRIICRQLESAWQALAVQCEFAERLPSGPAQALMGPEEKILWLSFELSIGENRGTLNVIVPAVVSGALLRKISVGWVREKRTASPDAQQRLRAHLLNCPFAVELNVIAGGARLRDLLALSPGAVLRLDQAVHQPARVRVSGDELFAATVARAGTSRVAKITQHPIPDTEAKP